MTSCWGVLVLLFWQCGETADIAGHSVDNWRYGTPTAVWAQTNCYNYKANTCLGEGAATGSIRSLVKDA